MKQKIHYFLLGAAVLSTSLLACKKENSSSSAALDQPHAVTVYLTDDQTPVFDSVFIDLQKLEVKVEDDSLDHGGWVEMAIRPGVYNILRFRNGLDTLFATGTLPNGHVQKIRLTLGTQNSVMVNGQSFPLTVKSNDRQVEANLDASNFDISQPGQIAFSIDFDAGRSIQTDNSGSGNNGGFRLKSHIRIFSKAKSGSIEGRVSPKAADALVMAISGTDTTMAIPDDDDGEFKIVGLKAGTYSVFVDGRNNYLDTTISNVVVRDREDTHVPVIALHQ